MSASCFRQVKVQVLLESVEKGWNKSEMEIIESMKWNEKKKNLNIKGFYINITKKIEKIAPFCYLKKHETIIV